MQPNQIGYIEFAFKVKDKKLLSEFALTKPKSLVKSDVYFVEKQLNIPVSIQPESLGKALDVTISNGFIISIDVVINNKRIDFLPLIKGMGKLLLTNHRANTSNFGENWKFYLFRDT